MSRNYEAIREHYAGNDRGDLDAMLAPVTGQTVWREMEGSAYPGTYVGRGDIIAGVFQKIGTDWENYRFTLDRLIDGGDTIVAIGTYSGTFKKTGKAMSARVVHVWDMEDGHAARFAQFADTRMMEKATR